jgi:hypothetical protein
MLTSLKHAVTFSIRTFSTLFSLQNGCYFQVRSLQLIIEIDANPCERRPFFLDFSTFFSDYNNLQLLSCAAAGGGGWMDGWIDGWMDGWMDGGRMDGWMGVCVRACVHAWRMDGWGDLVYFAARISNPAAEIQTRVLATMP